MLVFHDALTLVHELILVFHDVLILVHELMLVRRSFRSPGTFYQDPHGMNLFLLPRYCFLIAMQNQYFKIAIHLRISKIFIYFLMQNSCIFYGKSKFDFFFDALAHTSLRAECV